MCRLCNIPKHPSTYTDATLKRTIDHFYLSEGHRYRAPGPTEYLPTGRPGEVAIYQDSLKAGLRFPLHPFLVEFFCTFSISPGQLVPNALRMLNYYLLVCVRHGVDPSVDVFRVLFEMKLLNRYDCYIVFSHRDRGPPTHDHFKIPNCPSSNSGWKNRFFFVKPVAGSFPFPLDWGVPPLEEFNSTPILSEQEIDSLIILRATEPLGRSMNGALTDDALVSAGIGRPYGREKLYLHLSDAKNLLVDFRRTLTHECFADMSVDQFSEDFLEELARKNARGQKKRRREPRPFPSPSSDAALVGGQQAAEPVASQEERGVTEQLRTPESSRPRSPRVVSESRPSYNVRRSIDKVAEDCQAITSCLDWEVIETSKGKSPKSLERSMMVEERRIISLRHSAFRKIRDQAEKIDQTSRLLEEKNQEIRDCRRELVEKTVLFSEREAHFEKMLQDRDLQLQQSGDCVQTLEDMVAQLSQDLANKGKIAIEEYKVSEEYRTTVGMVGVRGREMALRKSREWLVEHFPNLDYSGAPFMPEVDDDDTASDD
ncbi:Uncharacterized protein Adt_31480 [Abeliophyllum distichum]|uniref:Transposase (putative) gypsy type domain-containing protein n=1 Tax=Abeliophyllum distichum TaxID=126358 RepID=A0ABD1RE69_9LAMI